jgi:hypothetical protein
MLRDPRASRISVVRTAVVSIVALSLGFFASRWKRVELVWVAYSAVALGALKPSRTFASVIQPR